jgi:hypothetical protein
LSYPHLRGRVRNDGATTILVTDTWATHVDSVFCDRARVRGVPTLVAGLFAHRAEPRQLEPGRSIEFPVLFSDSNGGGSMIVYLVEGRSHCVFRFAQQGTTPGRPDGWRALSNGVVVDAGPEKARR